MKANSALDELVSQSLKKDVERTELLLQENCHWACCLAENIAGYADSLSDVLKQINRVKDNPKKVQGATRDKFNAILAELRDYSRRMANETKPLTVIGISEDCQQINSFKRRLGKLMKKRRQK